MSESPLHGYRGDTLTPPPPAKPRGVTVAITREAGGGGSSIAAAVAERLGWQVFSQESLDHLVRDSVARDDLLSDLPAGALEWADAKLVHPAERRQIVPSSWWRRRRDCSSPAARGEGGRSSAAGRASCCRPPPRCTCGSSLSRRAHCLSRRLDAAEPRGGRDRSESARRRPRPLPQATHRRRPERPAALRPRAELDGSASKRARWSSSMPSASGTSIPPMKNTRSRHDAVRTI